MANVLVNEVNLVAIGDALRSRLGETKTMNGTMVAPCVPKVSKTPNATGFTTHDGKYPVNQSTFDVVTIPNATRLKVVMSYATSHHTQQDYVCILKGSHTNSADFNTATQYNSRGVLKMVTLYFDDTDTVTFHFHSDNGVPDNLLGYYAEVTAVDADGNVAEIEQTFNNLELPNTFKPSEMANAINSIPSGGSINIPTYTGNCNGVFANKNWDWVINELGSQIKTANISDATRMFADSKVTEIPFTVDMGSEFDGKRYGGYIDNMFYNANKLIVAPKLVGTGKTNYYNNMFQNCSKLEEVDFSSFQFEYVSGEDNGTLLENMFQYCENLKTLKGSLNGSCISPAKLFNSCSRLRTIPDDYFEGAVFSRGSRYSNGDSIFAYCYSLRQIPSSFMAYIAGGNGLPWNGDYSCLYNNTFTGCFVLDEIVDLPVLNSSNDSMFTNGFSAIVRNCARLKEFTFMLDEDGNPQVARWVNQTIDLTNIGYLASSSNKNYITGYNSGITEATLATYQSGSANPHSKYNELKDNPDFWTTEIGYSRYNHQSAVNTINSLPDTSAILAEWGGGATNTIKFSRLAGNYTNEGIGNKLTEAEIAVATAKGWTVTLV